MDMIDEPTRRFISQHADDDVRELALRGTHGQEVDLRVALEQIAGRQAARHKLPSWAANAELVFPPRLSMEQCSSEHTALYKARLATGGATLLDLTGGFGVDCAFMSPRFGHVTYVERDERLCQIATHNFGVLHLNNIEVVCGDAADALRRTQRVGMIYVDPARRDSHGGKVFRLADCSPDVVALRDELLDRADVVMLKLSPMLDWHKAVADMGGCVREVHVVSVRNECKELLLVCSRGGAGLRVVCVNDGQLFEFDANDAVEACGAVKMVEAGEAMPTAVEGAFLLVPNSSVMKAGCFGELERRFGIRQLAESSHLFLVSAVPAHFPGKAFRVRRMVEMNKRDLRSALVGMNCANVATRNFPLTADALRRRLRLRDGGSTFIFGTTTRQGKHVLMVCE